MKNRKSVLCVVLVIAVLVLVGSCVNFVYGSNTSKNIKHYRELTENVEALPKLDELGKYNEYSFKYYQKNMLIFFSDAYILKVFYDKENYEKEKSKLDEKYVFETEVLYDYRYDAEEEKYIKVYPKQPNFQIDTFDMRILSWDKHSVREYPHDFVFVGTSDKEQSICYIYYLDTDLDYIDTSFEEFLRKECGWE